MSTSRVLVTSNEDGDLVARREWRCPFAKCASHQARPFSSERGVRVHVSRQHGIDWRTGNGIARLYRHWQ